MFLKYLSQKSVSLKIIQINYFKSNNYEIRTSIKILINKIQPYYCPLDMLISVAVKATA